MVNRTESKIDLDAVRAMSRQQLAALGVNDVAYVKDVDVDGGTAFAIFAADGQQLAIMPDRDTAIATARENGLAPVTVH